METNGRFYGKSINVDSGSIKEFWNNNAKKDSSLKSVLLGKDFGANSADLHNQKETKILLDFIGNDKKDILDIGCGIGRWAYNLLSIINLYHGIDFSDEFIKAANNSFAKYENIQFFCASAAKIEYENLGMLKKYDLVISTGVSMYINDDELERIYSTINRLTTNGSFLYLQDTTSLLETRLTLKDFYSKELETKYNAIYRTRGEYENFFDKYLSDFELLNNGTDLLLDKESGAREETNARYWCFRKK